MVHTIALLVVAIAVGTLDARRHHHHHRRHHHHHNVKEQPNANVTAKVLEEAKKIGDVKNLEHLNSTEQQVADQITKLQHLVPPDAMGTGIVRGALIVNGPLPADFKDIFSRAVVNATECNPKDVTVLEETVKETEPSMLVNVVFQGPGAVVHVIEQQAADAESLLVKGELHSYLVAEEEEEEESPSDESSSDESTPEAETSHALVDGTHQGAQRRVDRDDGVPAEPSSAIDLDTDMPYGDLEPFGREDTAQELTEDSIQQSDSMVDQMEKAEVAEEKRAVFRSLTRLRGAAITSFDGIARSQTGNIDEYAHTHQWRETHPLQHLADEESDVSKWAFPSHSD